MKLYHKYTYLFEGFFEEHPEHASLKDLIGCIRKYAISRSAKELNVKKSEVVKSDEFRLYYGALGEVLSEFWLQMFAHELALAKIFDTSGNQFCRGFDFVSSSIFSDSLLALIQVKMRKDELKPFMMKDLTTLFDEVSKRGVMPQHVILLVPTSTLSKADILSYKEGFKREYSDRMIFIGYHRMLKSIQSLPKTSELSGVQQFIQQFKTAITDSKIVTI